MKKHKTCTKCEIHHVENCDTCFGFGLRRSGGIISASEAHDKKYNSYKECPECKGIPKKYEHTDKNKFVQ